MKLSRRELLKYLGIGTAVVVTPVALGKEKSKEEKVEEVAKVFEEVSNHQKKAVASGWFV